MRRTACFCTIAFIAVLVATPGFSQNACQSIGGTWINSIGFGGTWVLNQNSGTNAVTGTYTGPCTTWPITSGSMNPATGTFHVTASGVGCATTFLTATGTIGNSSPNYCAKAPSVAFSDNLGPQGTDSMTKSDAPTGETAHYYRRKLGHK